MSSLIRAEPVDFRLWRPTARTPGFQAETRRVAEPQEPIRVRVRVRQYGDSAAGAAQARRDRPDLGRLPVGTILDCLV